jgi:sulfate permease, SulP family
MIQHPEALVAFTDSALDFPKKIRRAASRLNNTDFNTCLTDVFSGLLVSVLTISFGLSYAVLIFSGPLAVYLPYGIASTFIAVAVIAGITSMGSSLRFAIAGPESATAAVTAILSASMTEHVIARDQSAQLLSPILLTLSAATVATGVILCALGLARLGRAIRYVPYPVIGGFLGATACLILSGAVQVISSERITFSTLSVLGDRIALAQLFAAGAMAFAICATWRRSRDPLSLPAILLIGVLATHLGFRASGLSIADAQTMGWTFPSPPKATLTLPWTLLGHVDYPWRALPGVVGNLLAVVFVTAISTLFNTTGLEVETRRQVDLDRELRVTGIANVLAGSLGGFAGCISLSRSLLAHSMGTTGRLSGLTVSVVAALMLVVDPTLIRFVPKFVLAGLLLYLGADQFNKWIIESRRTLSFVDYLSLLSIVGIILVWGFVAGVFIGIIIGCATFALSASRVDFIKYEFDGSEYRSSLDRSRDELNLLALHGREVQGLKLQSYLFFGSANRLHQHVSALLQVHPECRHLVLDFKLVTGIDCSAAYSFAQIKQLALERHIKIVLVNLRVDAERVLRVSKFISADVSIINELDHALEWCENEVIAEHRDRSQEKGNLRDWFAQILGSEADADVLIRHCRHVDVEAGDVIVRAGDRADSMHFLLEGRVGVMVATDDGCTTRVRSLGRYTTIGEMGLVANALRSATIQAEVASVLYVLQADQFHSIKYRHPALTHKLLTYFIAVMAERLNFANRAIGVLRR